MEIFCSHCPEHEWKTRAERFKPGKRSIFSVKTPQVEDDDDEAASDTDANDNVPDRGKSAPLPQERLQKKPVKTIKKKAAVVSSARSTPSTASSPSTTSGRATVTDLQEEVEDVSSEDELSIVVAEIGSIARDLDEVRSPSPNLQRDFARQYPCEGKQTGTSLLQGNRMINQAVKQGSVQSSDGSGIIGNENLSEKINASNVNSHSRQFCHGKESPVSDAFDDGHIVSKSKEGTSAAFHVESQTGSNKGNIMHKLSSSEKWKSGRNVMCYSSTYKGEASVQIKSPDILSSESASSNDDDDDEAGYLNQEEFSYSSSPGHADHSQNSGNSDKVSHHKPLSLPPPRSDIIDENSDSSNSTFEQDEGLTSLTRKVNASSNQRVSSAASQRSFIHPEVELLYSGQSGESSNVDSAHSDSSKKGDK